MKEEVEIGKRTVKRRSARESEVRRQRILAEGYATEKVCSGPCTVAM